MSRFYYSRFVFIALLLFLNNIAGAVSSEYKNSLEGIELHKTSENGYNINLYTQKSYSEPVKIIKKNDLSYYILLPETKNSSTPLKIKTSEIQDVNAKIYPYAGVDVNNGYTKINISTTKPIDFNLNIKSTSNNSASNTKPQVVAKKKQEQPVLKEEAKIAKTNTDSKAVNLKQKLTATANTIESKTTKNLNSIQDKKVVKNSTVKSKTASTKTVASDTSLKKTEETVKSKNTKIASSTSKRKDKELVVKKKIEETIENSHINEKKYEEPVEDFEEINDAIETNEINKSEERKKLLDKIEKQNKDLIAQNNDINDIEDYAYAAKLENGGFIELLQSKLNSIQTKLSDYNLGIFDVLLMLITGMIGFFVVLFIMSNRQSNPGSKRKADLFGENSKSSLVPKKNDDSAKDKGQYFVFDKNVKQTSLLKPATSNVKKNYELSTYDPDIRIDYNNNNLPKDDEKESSEYDIIQKILKEDVYVDIEPSQAETITKEKIETRITKEEPEEIIQKSNIVTSPIEQEKEVQQIQEEKPEPQAQSELIVLSKNEIAPERGFMCVSYENNVSLIGYIFDDIFVLHNFKKSELESYEIQSRLSERDISSSLYIVKVADDKMIIRVSNKSMKLEITL